MALKSSVLKRLEKNTKNSNVKKKTLNLIVKQMKKNIKTEKDINNKKFKKRKTDRDNKILYDTGNLYKNIKLKSNRITLPLYGIFNNNGTKNIDKREFIPTSGSKNLKIITQTLKKGL